MTQLDLKAANVLQFLSLITISYVGLTYSVKFEFLKKYLKVEAKRSVTKYRHKSGDLATTK